MEIAVTATNINAVTNHPEVRPCLWEGDWFIEMKHVVEEPRVVSCDFTDGYVLFSDLDGSGVWEAHVAFLPEAWGIRAYNCSRKALAYMFERSDVTKIKARPPVQNKRVARFCKALGFTYCGSGKIGGDVVYEAEIFTLTKDGLK